MYTDDILESQRRAREYAAASHLSDEGLDAIHDDLIDGDVYEAHRSELEYLMLHGSDEEFNAYLDELHHEQDLIDFGYDPWGEDDYADD